jgi:hypothetical protein
MASVIDKSSGKEEKEKSTGADIGNQIAGVAVNEFIRQCKFLDTVDINLKKKFQKNALAKRRCTKLCASSGRSHLGQVESEIRA